MVYEDHRSCHFTKKISGGEIVDVETRTGYKAHIKKKDLDFENPFTINCLICTHDGKSANLENKHEDLVDHLLHDHMVLTHNFCH